MSMNNRTRCLPAGRAVPQPIASPRVPNPRETKTKEKEIALCSR